jgi:hypothetical protein
MLDDIYKKYDNNKSYSYNNFHNKLKLMENHSFSTVFKNILTSSIKISYNNCFDNSDEYAMWIRAGFSDSEDTSISVLIDNNQIDIDYPEYTNEYKWIKIGYFNLEKGDHNVEIKTNSRNMAIDKILFIPKNEYKDQLKIYKDILDNYNYTAINCKNNFCSKEEYNSQKPETKLEKNKIQIVSWEMINPSKYIVRAIVNEPSFINLWDSYNNGWIAKYENKTSKSVLVNTIGNSFYISPHTLGKEIEIILEYSPQIFTNIGFTIYLISILGLTSALITILYKKSKNK